MSTLMILPCAGYGTRVGRPAAKEMLLDSLGKPLIQGPLELAQAYQTPVHLITRAGKESLVNFVQNWAQEHQHPVQIQLIASSREWPDTVLQSEAHWREDNLLLLPDTRFLPTTVIAPMMQSTADIKIATFPTEQPQLWGCLQQSEEVWQICDKPASFASGPQQALAWGLLGWKKQYGQLLMENILSSYFSKNWQPVPGRVETFPLQEFRDLTR